MTGRDGAAALPVAGRREVRSAVVDVVRRDRGAFVGVLALNVLASLAALGGPLLLGLLVDAASDDTAAELVDRYGALLLGLAVARLLLSRWANLAGTRFGERAQATIREHFLESALALPLRVVERSGSGDLTARGISDIPLVGESLRDAIPASAIAIAQAVLIAIAAIVVDPLLGGVGLLGLLGVVLSTRWYLRRARDAYLAQGAALSGHAGQLAATMRGARTVELFGLQTLRRDTCDAAITEFRRAQRRTLGLRTVFYPSIDISVAVPAGLALLLGAVLVDHGATTVGAVVSVTLYMQQLAQPTSALLLYVEQLQGCAAAFARVQGVSERPSTAPVPQALPPSDDTLKVDAVSYAYDAADVLHDVSVTARPGEHLAVVGPSGAGKSTLGMLMAGDDTPRAGTVTVGGVEVASMPGETLRSHVLRVTQEQHLFHGTLRDNLSLATPDADDPALEAALERVGATWVSALEDGLETQVGDGATALHAGQVQQVALARVVLADPHTVILDEATSLLDPVTATSTERALYGVLEGRTIISIAHRLQTAKEADRIAIMEGGTITELGTHDELVRRDGAYARLWHAWVGSSDGPVPSHDGAAAPSDHHLQEG
ncbi:MAG: ABC transporter ATP-binding protein [Mycobacteriales bacterium]